MNVDANETWSVAISGHLVIRRDDIERLLRIVLSTQKPQPEVPAAKSLPEKFDRSRGGVPRLAYTIGEAAEALGILYCPICRLIERGLIRRSLALRRPIIARTELERLLKETSREISI